MGKRREREREGEREKERQRDREKKEHFEYKSPPERVGYYKLKSKVFNEKWGGDGLEKAQRVRVCTILAMWFPAHMLALHNCM